MPPVLRLVHRDHRRAARIVHGVLRIGGVGGIGGPLCIDIIGLERRHRQHPGGRARGSCPRRGKLHRIGHDGAANLIGEHHAMILARLQDCRRNLAAIRQAKKVWRIKRKNGEEVS